MTAKKNNPASKIEDAPKVNGDPEKVDNLASSFSPTAAKDIDEHSSGEPSQSPINHDESVTLEDDFIEFSFSDGEIIFTEGDKSELAYVIVEGTVELCKYVEETEIHIADIDGGGVFGEMGVLDGSPRSATARAKGDVKLKAYNQETLTQLVHDNAAFALPIMNQLVANLRATSNKLAHNQFLTISTSSQKAESHELKPEGTLARLRHFFDADGDINEFQPDTVEIERRKMPGAAYVMMFTIIGLLMTAILYASFSFVDTTVVATGRLTTTSSNIVLQPLETSVVRTVLVKKGDLVEKDQVLATLDPTFVEADIGSNRAVLDGLLSQESRLQAELYDLEGRDFSEINELNQLELEVFRRRQTEFAAKLEAKDQRVKQLEAQISTNKQDAAGMTEQIAVIKEIEAMRIKLMDDGYGSRVNYLGAKNQRLMLEREQRKIKTDNVRARRELDAAAAEREAFVSEWRSKVATELVQVRRKIEETSGQLIKSERRSTLVQISAPADGVVLELADRGVGSVIRGAEPLITLVPLNVDLRVDANISPQDVSKVQIGDVVRIKLDSLPFQKHGTLQGEITLISEDTIETDVQGRPMPMYQSQVNITANNLEGLSENFRLLPGMTASAEIKVGKRRLITYFIYPLVRTFSTSFREP